MDGIAVRSEDTWGAAEQRPVSLACFFRVNTGNVIPSGFDAVIMIEDVTFDGEKAVIRKAAGPWQHVRPAGEDIAESEMILPSSHRIRPHEIGALAAYGISHVPALTVRVGLVPTGSELVVPGTKPAPGQVVESNTVMAGAWLRSLGAECLRYPVTPDQPDLISERVSQAVAGNDIVIVSAGSSAGTRDYTAEVISGLGEVLVHGIAIKPGKPAIIGKIDGKPVIGMPGYPLSALTVIREIIVPLLGRYGLSAPDPESLFATLAMSLYSETGTCEYVLLAIGKIRGSYMAIPLSRGSGVQMSGVRAHAFLRIPPDSEGYEAGERVPVTLMMPRATVDQTLLISGSHDPVLDCLLELLQREGVTLHSSHTGSMGGVLALKRGSCHAAPVHLLHPSGDYNLPFLRQYLPDEDITLVCVAGREQGIASREGLSLADLPSHTYVNRQKGSGTRMLLDYELIKQGLIPDRSGGMTANLPPISGSLSLCAKARQMPACVFILQHRHWASPLSLSEESGTSLPSGQRTLMIRESGPCSMPSDQNGSGRSFSSLADMTLPVPGSCGTRFSDCFFRSIAPGYSRYLPGAVPGNRSPAFQGCSNLRKGSVPAPDCNNGIG
jgi:putative molybdopterin biosynthesis protein